MNPNDRDPVIIDAVRTPVGRAGGTLSSVRPDDLLAHTIRELMRRTGIPVDRIEDIIARMQAQAEESGLAPEIAEAVFRCMIDSFIEFEKDE